jgi:hypothetical protein
MFLMDIMERSYLQMNIQSLSFVNIVLNGWKQYRVEKLLSYVRLAGYK